MTHYIETPTKSGGILKIEVEDTSKPSTGFARSTQPTNVSSEAAKSAYDDLLQAIQSCAAGVVETIQNMPASPSSASVDFAIKVDGEVGVMIARSREDAQFRVSLSWKQPEPDKPDADK